MKYLPFLLLVILLSSCGGSSIQIPTVEKYDYIEDYTTDQVLFLPELESVFLEKEIHKLKKEMKKFKTGKNKKKPCDPKYAMLIKTVESKENELEENQRASLSSCILCLSYEDVSGLTFKELEKKCKKMKDECGSVINFTKSTLGDDEDDELEPCTIPLPVNLLHHEPITFRYAAKQSPNRIITLPSTPIMSRDNSNLVLYKVELPQNLVLGDITYEVIRPWNIPGEISSRNCDIL